MFKIVHCKAPDEDVIRILDNVEETSLSAVQEEDDEDEEEEEEEEDGDIEDDTIEEAEYVHPEKDEYLDEEDDETIQQRYANPEHNVQIENATKCTCTHKGIKNKIEFGLNKCVHSRPCSICVYLCLTLMVLASIVALIVISVLIVVPYTKAASYQSSNCTPVGINVDPEDRRCSCGKGCSSLYPCLQIRVLITAVNYSYVDIRSSILYENEAVFMRKCSYYPPCKSSQIANDKSVSNYQQRFGVIGQSFSCLFNPVNPRQVIRTRRFHLRHVLHGTVWSSMMCVASSSALVLIIKKRGCIYI